MNFYLSIFVWLGFTFFNWIQLIYNILVSGARHSDCIFKASVQLQVITKMCAQSLSLIWLCDPMDHSPPGSSVQGIFQARIMEWVAISSSRGSFWPREWTHISCVSCVDRRILYNGTTWESLLQDNYNSQGYTLYLCCLFYT